MSDRQSLYWGGKKAKGIKCAVFFCSSNSKSIIAYASKLIWNTNVNKMFTFQGEDGIPGEDGRKVVSSYILPAFLLNFYLLTRN